MYQRGCCDAWDIKLIERNVAGVLKTGTKIQLIYTHTRKNSACLPMVLELALKWRADLQVIDLICSRNLNPKRIWGMSVEMNLSRLLKYAKFKEKYMIEPGLYLNFTNQIMA